MAVQKLEYARERAKKLPGESDPDYDEDLREFEVFTHEVADIAKWGKLANMHITNLRLRIEEQIDEWKKTQKMKFSSPDKKRQHTLIEYRKLNNGIKVLAGGLRIVRKLCESQCQWVKRVQDKCNRRSAKNVFVMEIKLRKLLDIMSKEQMDCVDLLEQRLDQLRAMQAVDEAKPE